MTKREYLKHLVSGKAAAFRPLTLEEKALGFLGWHERGYLPHCDYPGLVQFVTFRLADSMPASRRAEWKHLLDLDMNVRRPSSEAGAASRTATCCVWPNPIFAPSNRIP
jgi:hypothetical protein